MLGSPTELFFRISYRLVDDEDEDDSDEDDIEEKALGSDEDEVDEESASYLEILKGEVGLLKDSF